MTGAEIRDYFSAARDLRQALRRNREDTEFGHIVYVVDTNIAVAFLTGRQRERSSSVRNLMSREAAELSDSLTYQYIFSGGLPGMKARETVLISQPHWDELIRYIRRNAVDIESDFKKLPRLTDEQRIQLRAVRNQPVALMEQASAIGIDLIIGQFKIATRYRKRVEAILAGPKKRIIPLDESPFWNVIDGKISNNDFREWSYLITEARSPKDKDDTTNIEADAKTLAAIETLYRETEAAVGEENALIKFVFITSDAAILKAYNQRRPYLAKQGIPDFVRHPLVYHPLLNFSSMHRASSSLDKVSDQIRSVFLDVEGAVEALFPQGDEALSDDSAKRRWKRTWDLKDNMERWSNAAERIAIANINLFGREVTLEPSDEEIYSYFQSDELALEVYRSVHRTISGIEENHTRHMAEQSFDRLVEMIRQPGGLGRERRAPLSLPSGLDILQNARRRDTSVFDQIQTFDDLLDHLARYGRPIETSPVAQRISEALREYWDDPSIQLLATAIYMAMGSWDLAISCAQICIRTASLKDARSELVREARYCKAVSLRMLLRSEREIALAREALNENLASRRPNALLLERDRIERATLTLSACIVQAIEQLGVSPRQRRLRRMRPLISSDDIATSFDNESQELDDSLRTLNDNFLGTGSLTSLVASILGQAAVNRLGAEIFRFYLGEGVSKERPQLDTVYQSIGNVLQNIDGNYALSLMGRIYIGIAKVELGLKSSPQLVIDEIDRRREITKLAHGDDYEYDFLRMRMASLASAEIRAA